MTLSLGGILLLHGLGGLLGLLRGLVAGPLGRLVLRRHGQLPGRLLDGLLLLLQRLQALGQRSGIPLLGFPGNALLQFCLQAGKLAGGFARIVGQFDGAVQSGGQVLQLAGGLVLMLEGLLRIALFEGLGGPGGFLRLERSDAGSLGRLLGIAGQFGRLLRQFLLFAGQFGQALGLPLLLRLSAGPSQFALGLGQLAGFVGQLLGRLGAGRLQRLLQFLALIGQALKFAGHLILLPLNLILLLAGQRVAHGVAGGQLGSLVGQPLLFVGQVLQLELIEAILGQLLIFLLEFFQLFQRGGQLAVGLVELVEALLRGRLLFLRVGQRRSVFFNSLSATWNAFSASDCSAGVAAASRASSFRARWLAWLSLVI